VTSCFSRPPIRCRAGRAGPHPRACERRGVAEVREEAFDLRPELHVDRRQGVDVGISHGSEPLARKPSLSTNTGPCT